MSFNNLDEINEIKAGYLFKDGRYQVLKDIGEGAFGTVYSVFDHEKLEM